MKRIAALPVLLLIPALGLAQPTVDGVSYDYLQIGLIKADLDVPGADLEGDGLSLEYSVDVREHVHLFGAYEQFDIDGIDGDSNRKLFGIGTNFAPTDKLSLYGRLAGTTLDVDLGTGNVGDEGFMLEGGLRYMIGDGWELRGGAQYVDLEDGGSDTFLSVGGDFYLTDAVALSVVVDDRDDTTVGLIGLRFYFDKDPGPDRRR